MMQDLVNSCYGNLVSAIKPEIYIESETSLIQEERDLSPVHMSSASSVCSKRSGFSTRLTKLDCTMTLKYENEKIPLAVGRGRSLPFRFLPDDLSLRTYEDEDEASTVISDRSSPVSSIMGKGTVIVQYKLNSTLLLNLDLSPPSIQERDI